MKYLTEWQAWLKLAAAWKAAKPNFIGDYATQDGHWGLCSCVAWLAWKHEITPATEMSMRRKITSEQQDRGGYAWSWNIAGARARVKFCLAQARRLAPKKKAGAA